MNRIKELRIKKDCSQAKLADILGVTQATLSGWELDKWQPDIEMLCKIANFFDVSIDYLLARTEYENYEKDYKPILDDFVKSVNKEFMDMILQLQNLSNEHVYTILHMIEFFYKMEKDKTF